MAEDHAGPTLFNFPSRHHQLPSTKQSTYHSEFISPIGLHPKLCLNFHGQVNKPSTSCSLHVYLTLPSSLFVDKYQLSSSNFLASNNLRAVRALSGETDLEAPGWAVSRWGSALLLELAPPTFTNGMWSAEFPLHLRYLQSNDSKEAEPSADAATATIPWPVVFWACPAEAGNRMSTNPFDRVNLGFDGFFGPKTIFHHLIPLSNSSLFQELSVPILPCHHTLFVERVTVSIIVLGFLAACWTLFLSWWRMSKSNLWSGRQEPPTSIMI